TWLSRGQSLQAEAGEQEGARDSPGRALDGEPELHRQRQRQEDDGGRRVDRRRERPDALEDDRYREDERREVGAAPGREASRTDGAAPRVGEAAFFGGRDRTVLGAVQSERPPAQEPKNEAQRHTEAREQRRALRQEREEQRRSDSGSEQEPLARLRDPAPAEQRRHR